MEKPFWFQLLEDKPKEYLSKLENTYWVYLLENNPQNYFSKLETIYLEDIDKAQQIVNHIDYNMWMGNHSHALSHLVGSLINNKDNGYFGCKCRHLDEELGIKLIKLMYLCNVDLSVKDYYGQTPLECILESKNGSLTHRNNNDNFILLLENLTNKFNLYKMKHNHNNQGNE